MAKSLDDKLVVVGMTGGADSTAAAFLLKKQGYKPIGVALVTLHEKFLKEPPPEYDEDGNLTNPVKRTNSDYFLDVCTVNQLENVQDVCEKLDIPFYAANLIGPYQAEVLDPMVEKLIGGEFFNPCLQCNNLKIRSLIEKADKLGAAHVATGHYAKQVRNYRTGKYLIKMANDKDNDQSHFLVKVRQEYLSRLILPLGEILKPEVEKIMRTYTLPDTPRRSGKRICMMGNDGMKRLIEESAHKEFRPSGMVYDDNDGQVAEHDGIHQFVIGQKVTEINDEILPKDRDYHIVALDLVNKIIRLGKLESLKIRGVGICEVVMEGITDFTHIYSLYATVGSKEEKYRVKVSFKNNQNGVVEFSEDVLGLYKGVSIAFFDSQKGNALLVGGGTVSYTGTLEMVNQTESVQSTEHDDDGNVIHKKVPDFLL